MTAPYMSLAPEFSETRTLIVNSTALGAALCAAPDGDDMGASVELRPRTTVAMASPLVITRRLELAYSSTPYPQPYGSRSKNLTNRMAIKVMSRSVCTDSPAAPRASGRI